MRFRQGGPAALALLFVLLVAAAGVCASIGAVKIPLGQVLRMMVHELPWVGDRLVTPDWPPANEIIVLKVRLPRVVLAGLVGAGLSVAGAMFQGLLRNPLADPYIIGVSAGASLGASVALVFGLAVSVAGLSSVPVMAFFGAVGTMLLVYAMGRVHGKISVDTFLLSGVVVGSFLWAMVSFLMVVAGEELTGVVMWLMGSLSGRSWQHAAMAAPYVAVGTAVAWARARDLNVMALGEEAAAYTGLDVERFKKVIIVAASLTTAAAVSVSGVIGFVGLMIPHISRMVFGPDHRTLIPASAMVGAGFLMAADTVARTVAAPAELPVGIITALMGGPFFFYLLKAKKRDVIF